MVFGTLGRLFGKVRQGLAKTRSALGDALRSLIGASRTIDDDFLDELEYRLIAADIGVTKSEAIIDEIKQRWKKGEQADGEDLMALIKRSLREELEDRRDDELAWAASGTTVVLVIGVNGAGKTTS
ncbi:MAG: signal recognition particle receptor subunit alpha, partial [Planctomycetota bacterium]